MLVLIATNELQGAVADDYAWTVEGELVTAVVSACAASDRCGCRRGFPGLASSRATTTAMIVDRPGVSELDLRDAVYDWLDRSGWVDLVQADIAARLDTDGDELEVFDEVAHVVEDLIDEHVGAIHAVCRSFPEGTIVTRCGNLVSARSLPWAA